MDDPDLESRVAIMLRKAEKKRKQETEKLKRVVALGSNSTSSNCDGFDGDINVTVNCSCGGGDGSGGSTDLTEVNSRLTNLENADVTIRGDITNLTDVDAIIQNDLDIAESAITALQDRVTPVETRLTEAETDVVGLSEDTVALQTALDVLTTAHTDLEETVNLVINGVETVDKEISPVPQDWPGLTVMMARVTYNAALSLLASASAIVTAVRLGEQSVKVEDLLTRMGVLEEIVENWTGTNPDLGDLPARVAQLETEMAAIQEIIAGIQGDLELTGTLKDAVMEITRAAEERKVNLSECLVFNAANYFGSRGNPITNFIMKDGKPTWTYSDNGVGAMTWCFTAGFEELTECRLVARIPYRFQIAPGDWRYPVPPGLRPMLASEIGTNDDGSPDPITTPTSRLFNDTFYCAIDSQKGEVGYWANSYIYDGLEQVPVVTPQRDPAFEDGGWYLNITRESELGAPFYGSYELGRYDDFSSDAEFGPNIPLKTGTIPLEIINPDDPPHIVAAKRNPTPKFLLRFYPTLENNQGEDDPLSGDLTMDFNAIGHISVGYVRPYCQVEELPQHDDEVGSEEVRKEYTQVKWLGDWKMSADDLFSDSDQVMRMLPTPSSLGEIILRGTRGDAAMFLESIPVMVGERGMIAYGPQDTDVRAALDFATMQYIDETELRETTLVKAASNLYDALDISEIVYANARSTATLAHHILNLYTVTSRATDLSFGMAAGLENTAGLNNVVEFDDLVLTMATTANTSPADPKMRMAVEIVMTKPVINSQDVDTHIDPWKPQPRAPVFPPDDHAPVVNSNKGIHSATFTQLVAGKMTERMVMTFQHLNNSVSQPFVEGLRTGSGGVGETKLTENPGAFMYNLTGDYSTYQQEGRFLLMLETSVPPGTRISYPPVISLALTMSGDNIGNKPGTIYREFNVNPPIQDSDTGLTTFVIEVDVPEFTFYGQLKNNSGGQTDGLDLLTSAHVIYQEQDRDKDNYRKVIGACGGYTERQYPDQDVYGGQNGDAYQIVTKYRCGIQNNHSDWLASVPHEESPLVGKVLVPMSWSVDATRPVVTECPTITCRINAPFTMKVMNDPIKSKIIPYDPDEMTNHADLVDLTNEFVGLVRTLQNTKNRIEYIAEKSKPTVWGTLGKLAFMAASVMEPGLAMAGVIVSGTMLTFTDMMIRGEYNSAITTLLGGFFFALPFLRGSGRPVRVPCKAGDRYDMGTQFEPDMHDISTQVINNMPAPLKKDAPANETDDYLMIALENDTLEQLFNLPMVPDYPLPDSPTVSLRRYRAHHPRRRIKPTPIPRGSTTTTETRVPMSDDTPWDGDIIDSHSNDGIDRSVRHTLNVGPTADADVEIHQPPRATNSHAARLPSSGEVVNRCPFTVKNSAGEDMRMELEIRSSEVPAADVPGVVAPLPRATTSVPHPDTGPVVGTPPLVTLSKYDPKNYRDVKVATLKDLDSSLVNDIDLELEKKVLTQQVYGPGSLRGRGKSVKAKVPKAVTSDRLASRFFERPDYNLKEYAQIPDVIIVNLPTQRTGATESGVVAAVPSQVMAEVERKTDPKGASSDLAYGLKYGTDQAFYKSERNAFLTASSPMVASSLDAWRQYQARRFTSPVTGEYSRDDYYKAMAQANKKMSAWWDQWGKKTPVSEFALYSMFPRLVTQIKRKLIDGFGLSSLFSTNDQSIWGWGQQDRVA